jgi:hypothetical protein
MNPEAWQGVRLQGLRLQHWGALLLLALCLATAWHKAGVGMLPELFWSCHVSAWILVLSLLCGWSRVSATGCILQLAATPVYLIYLAQGGSSHWSSIGVHLVAPLLGVFAWWRRPWPRTTAWWGLGAYFVLYVFCWLFTPERFNVNLVFHPAIFLPGLGEWGNRGLNWLLILASLWIWQTMWNKIFK